MMLRSNGDGNDSFVVIQNEESMIGQGTRRKHEQGGINKKVAILSFLSIIWLCQILITPLVFAEYGLKTSIITPDDSSDASFGYSLAISDEYIIVGASLSDIG